jgi:predicted metal-dependent hydrolase
MMPAARAAPETLTVEDVTFALRRSARRRTIGISIPREGPPVVAVPARCSRRAAQAAVHGKLAWVRRKLAERDARTQLPPLRYEAGERFPYRGAEHELVVIDDVSRAEGPTRGARPATRDAGASDGQLAFDVSMAPGDRIATRSPASLDAAGGDGALRLRDGRFELLESARADAAEHFRTWYRRHATDVLNARVAHFAPLVGVAPPPIAIKDMRSRWGSCSAKGRVSLYWGLVLLEPALLDYVVVHELVHLLELNHQLAFWRGVARLLPDYRARRKRLRSESARSVV